MSNMPFNPSLNLRAFAVQSTSAAPPRIHALYLRDGKYDGMTRDDVAATFAAFQAQTATKRLALFFHGGLVDKASGQQGAAKTSSFLCFLSGNRESGKYWRTIFL